MEGSDNRSPALDETGQTGEEEVALDESMTGSPSDMRDRLSGSNVAPGAGNRQPNGNNELISKSIEQMQCFLEKNGCSLDALWKMNNSLCISIKYQFFVQMTKIIPCSLFSNLRRESEVISLTMCVDCFVFFFSVVVVVVLLKLRLGIIIRIKKYSWNPPQPVLANTMTPVCHSKGIIFLFSNYVKIKRDNGQIIIRSVLSSIMAHINSTIN